MLWGKVGFFAPVARGKRSRRRWLAGRVTGGRRPVAGGAGGALGRMGPHPGAGAREGRSQEDGSCCTCVHTRLCEQHCVRVCVRASSSVVRLCLSFFSF